MCLKQIFPIHTMVFRPSLKMFEGFGTCPDNQSHQCTFLYSIITFISDVIFYTYKNMLLIFDNVIVKYNLFGMACHKISFTIRLLT